MEDSRAHEIRQRLIVVGSLFGFVYFSFLVASDQGWISLDGTLKTVVIVVGGVYLVSHAIVALIWIYLRHRYREDFALQRDLQRDYY